MDTASPIPGRHPWWRSLAGPRSGPARRAWPAIREIDFTDYEIAIPAFLTIVLMPFSYSIAN
ncbi:hypothetical protein ACWDR9_35250, partial [Streptosporangium sandarakinum]